MKVSRVFKIIPSDLVRGKESRIFIIYLFIFDSW